MKEPEGAATQYDHRSGDYHHYKQPHPPEAV